MLRHSRRNYPLYARWYGDEEIWHLTSWAAAPLSRHDAQMLFENRESSSTDDSFAVHLKDLSEPIGIISLMNISKANAAADLSVILGHPEHRGRGYGTEAIELILRYGFEDMRLHRIGLTVFEFNTAAISVYRKLGFREEGRLRQAIKRGNTFYDVVLMGILDSEWRNARSS